MHKGVNSIRGDESCALCFPEMFAIFDTSVFLKGVNSIRADESSALVFVKLYNMISLSSRKLKGDVLFLHCWR